MKNSPTRTGLWLQAPFLRTAEKLQQEQWMRFWCCGGLLLTIITASIVYELITQIATATAVGVTSTTKISEDGEDVDGNGEEQHRLLDHSLEHHRRRRRS